MLSYYMFCYLIEFFIICLENAGSVIFKVTINNIMEIIFIMLFSLFTIIFSTLISCESSVGIKWAQRHYNVPKEYFRKWIGQK